MCFCEYTGFDIKGLIGVDPYSKYTWNHVYPFSLITYQFLLMVRNEDNNDDNETWDDRMERIIESRKNGIGWTVDEKWWEDDEAMM